MTTLIIAQSAVIALADRAGHDENGRLVKVGKSGG